MTWLTSLRTVYVLSTIPTWYLVDIWGRRPILMAGSLVMAFALSSVGYFLYLDKAFTPSAVVIGVIVFNAAFGFSWGPIPWLYPPEVISSIFFHTEPIADAPASPDPPARFPRQGSLA